MALSWVLKDPRVTSVLVGVSSVRQLSDNLVAMQNTEFDTDELNKINEILKRT